jgi:hypothetical protein
MADERSRLRFEDCSIDTAAMEAEDSWERFRVGLRQGYLGYWLRRDLSHCGIFITTSGLAQWGELNKLQYFGELCDM